MSVNRRLPNGAFSASHLGFSAPRHVLTGRWRALYVTQSDAAAGLGLAAWRIYMRLFALFATRALAMLCRCCAAGLAWPPAPATRTTADRLAFHPGALQGLYRSRHPGRGRSRAARAKSDGGFFSDLCRLSSPAAPTIPTILWPKPSRAKADWPRPAQEPAPEAAPADPTAQAPRPSGPRHRRRQGPVPRTGRPRPGRL